MSRFKLLQRFNWLHGALVLMATALCLRPSAAATTDITVPLHGAFYATLAAATGTATPASGSVVRVTGRLYRPSSATTAAGYWAGGPNWTATYSNANELPCSGTTTWSFALGDMAAGSYTFRATATDSGGQRTASPTYTFRIDRTPPAATMTQPAADNLTFRSLPVVKGTAADSDIPASGVARATVCLFRNAAGTAPAGYWLGGTAWSETYNTANEIACSGTKSWGCTLPALAEGAYTCRVTVVDKVGNTATVSRSFTIDTTPPAIVIGQPAIENGRYAGLETVGGTAGDNSAITGVTCWLYRYARPGVPAAYWAGGTVWTPTYTNSNELPGVGTNTWSLSLPILLAGSYALRATATDAAGNRTQTSFRHFSVSGLQITSPRRDVAECPSVATLAVTDEGGTFFIPYIQTGTSLTVAASLGYLTAANRGVEFVLNDGEASEQAQQIFGSGYIATFDNLAKGTYTLDAYLLDGSGQRLSGSGTHDRLESIGIGDIIMALGDSLTAGDKTDDYGLTPVTKWTDIARGGGWALNGTWKPFAGAFSQDNRNYPQHVVTNGAYRTGYPVHLNDLLTPVYDYPVFIMNEGRSGASTGTYKTAITNADFAARVAALSPNRWLLHLGVNDASANISPAAVEANLQSIITTLKVVYGAMPHHIFLARLSYAKPEATYATRIPALLPVIDNLIATNGLRAGPDFYNFFAANADLYYFDLVHPNFAGTQEMARLWFEAMTAAPAPTPAPPVVAPEYLSGGTARVARPAVSLVFTPALQSGAATAAARYQVAINGKPAGVTGVTYHAPVRMVTLTLEPGALAQGDTVTVTWQGLRTATGLVFSGGTGKLTAR